MEEVIIYGVGVKIYWEEVSGELVIDEVMVSFIEYLLEMIVYGYVVDFFFCFVRKFYVYELFGKVNDFKYYCFYCRKVFKIKYIFEKYMRMFEYISDRLFVCLICGKGFWLFSMLCWYKIIYIN